MEKFGNCDSQVASTLINTVMDKDLYRLVSSALFYYGNE